MTGMVRLSYSIFTGHHVGFLLIIFNILLLATNFFFFTLTESRSLQSRLIKKKKSLKVDEAG